MKAKIHKLIIVVVFIKRKQSGCPHRHHHHHYHKKHLFHVAISLARYFGHKIVKLSEKKNRQNRQSIEKNRQNINILIFVSFY